MTLKQFNLAVAQAGFSNRELALILGVEERSVYRWLAGQHKIPPMVGSVVGLLLSGAITPGEFIEARGERSAFDWDRTGDAEEARQ